MLSFGHPWSLGLLALLPVLIWRALNPGRSPAVRFPDLRAFEPPRRSRADAAPGILAGLRGAALGLTVLALAAPRQSSPPLPVRAEGIGIVMVLDVSSSMKTPDYAIDGGRFVSRLDAVKRVFRRFVAGGGSLPGRPDDLIGMVAFANVPDVACPPTLDRAVLLSQLSSLRIARPSEDGTNIGDALAWATESLRSVPTRRRVLILLTDGINEPVGSAEDRPLDPLEAARIAAAEGMRIYTIGVGGRPRATPSAPPAGVDESLLRRIASLTGGAFQRADDTAALERIYASIDRLERTPVTRWQTSELRELYLPFALAAWLLLVLEQMLGATLLRRLP